MNNTCNKYYYFFIFESLINFPFTNSFKYNETKIIKETSISKFIDFWNISNDFNPIKIPGIQIIKKYLYFFSIF